MVTLVDESDNEIGTKARELLSNDDRWRIVTIWIFNDQNELLLAKRPMHMKNDPGKWGPSVAGTLEHGDSYLQTAEREVKEEIGVEAPLTEVKLLMHKADIGHRANMNFRGNISLPISAFTPQPEEVDELTWMPYKIFLAELESNPDKYIEAMDIVKELFGNE